MFESAVAEEATAVLVAGPTDPFGSFGGPIIGGWDVPAWDIGSIDESIPTVIHLYGNTFTP